MSLKGFVVFASLSLVAVALTGGWSKSSAQTSENTQDRCCFTHSDYSGVCEVEPGEDETCQSILEYLNTPMSTGKTYCGGTEIRGGWQRAACEE